MYIKFISQETHLEPKVLAQNFGNIGHVTCCIGCIAKDLETHLGATTTQAEPTYLWFHYSSFIARRERFTSEKDS